MFIAILQTRLGIYERDATQFTSYFIDVHFDYTSAAITPNYLYPFYFFSPQYAPILIPADISSLPQTPPFVSSHSILHPHQLNFLPLTPWYANM